MGRGGRRGGGEKFELRWFRLKAAGLHSPRAFRLRSTVQGSRGGKRQLQIAAAVDAAAAASAAAAAAAALAVWDAAADYVNVPAAASATVAKVTAVRNAASAASDGVVDAAAAAAAAVGGPLGA